MKKFWLFYVMTICSMVGCRTTTGEDSESKTNLLDNAAVARVFKQFVDGDAHCRLDTSSVMDKGSKDYVPRVILTGFGLFGGAFNISGILSMSMASQAFWPDDYDATKKFDEPQSTPFSHATLSSKNGAIVRQRQLVINKRKIDVCFLLLDVVWDQAAAIILNESSLFKPDVVILSGMNGAEDTELYFETGAVNAAVTSSGFSSRGVSIPSNVPTGNDLRILSELPEDEVMVMTWEATKLAEQSLPLVKAVSTEVSYTAAAVQVRPTNDYICNNVSFAVTAGLTGRPVKLAGGLISLAAMNIGTKVGFLHIPYESSRSGRADNKKEVFRWLQVLAKIMEISLPPAPKIKASPPAPSSPAAI